MPQLGMQTKMVVKRKRNAKESCSERLVYASYFNVSIILFTLPQRHKAYSHTKALTCDSYRLSHYSHAYKQHLKSGTSISS